MNQNSGFQQVQRASGGRAAGMNTCYVKDKERGPKEGSPLNPSPEKQELALVDTMEAQRAGWRGAGFRLLLSLTVPEGTWYFLWMGK